jgi:hypothetical protein
MGVFDRRMGVLGVFLIGKWAVLRGFSEKMGVFG